MAVTFMILCHMLLERSAQTGRKMLGFFIPYLNGLLQGEESTFLTNAIQGKCCCLGITLHLARRHFHYALLLLLLKK
jgi:hypothetical protein